jgi:exopolysaccharide biosynthesis polyprenyl glycosylphosphotransferase
MSLGQRLAWIEGIVTLAALGVAALATLPAVAIEAHLPGEALKIALVTGLCFSSLYYADLYDFDVPNDLSSVFTRGCRALGVAAILLAVAGIAAPSMVLGGAFAARAVVVTLVAIVAIRATAYALAKRAPFSRRVLILGGGPLADELAEQIRARPDLTLTLIAVAADVSPGPEGGVALERTVAAHRVDHIIVTTSDRRGALPLATLLTCRARGIRVEEGATAYERFTRRLPVQSLNPSALIFGDGFRVSRVCLVLQRALSVGVACLGLLVAAPAMAVIALLIALDSRGPVFFVQERVGLRGRVFRLIKFRTMHVRAEGDDAVWGRDNERRVTRVGRVLRRYRLDELPQFINILRGDMVLVGPRPEMAGNVATFRAAIPYYDLRHEVRPGLTGWAQIRAGYSMSTEEVTRKLCYDLYYVKHLSLRFDLRILVDTAKFVIAGRRGG